jgi:hypothetical protein
MSIAPPSELLQRQMQQTLANLGTFVEAAAREGTAIHELERGLWQALLRLGQQCLSHRSAAFTRLTGMYERRRKWWQRDSATRGRPATSRRPDRRRNTSG